MNFLNKTVLNVRIIMSVSIVAYILTYLSGPIRYYFILNNISSGFINILTYKLSTILWYGTFLTVFIYVCACLLFLYRDLASKKPNKFVYFLIAFISAILFVTSSYMLKLESDNFSNYIYSLYGFSVDKLNLYIHSSSIIFISYVVALVLQYKNKIKKYNFSNNHFPVMLGLVVMVWFSIQNLLNLNGYISFASSGYEAQFEDFDKINMIIDNTDQKSSILIPVQSSSFPAFSNGPIMRYFLFPRTIVSSSYFIDIDEKIDIEELYFVYIKNDKNTWPYIDKKNSMIFISDEKGIEYEELELIYQKDDDILYKIRL